MATFIKSDLEFILEQILIAEAHAAGAELSSLLPNTEVSFGLRTVDGSFNNLVAGRTHFGAADQVFPRLSTAVFNTAEGAPANFFGLGSPAGPLTSYSQTSGAVFDSQPRTISNLIVDQTPGNPAADAAAAATPGSTLVTSPGLDGQFGTADDTLVHFIPNVAPDEGLSAPFNSWMTFFGQFFDHGLDLVTKGGNGVVFIPLQPDDPLYRPGSPTNFMVLTRATQVAGPGADGVLGTADDTSHEAMNTTSPFVDQNQTYSSHPSHQVFLRAYEMRDGAPVATGRLITNRNLGDDGRFGTADDAELGGMATWAVVKAQARDLLGIDLTDADVGNIPLLATDPYGNFLRGPNGFPQVVMRTAGDDGLLGTADDGTELVEGNPLAPISLANAVRIGHAFLDDIAHAANPAGKTADSDSVVGLSEAGAYDDELLDAHYIAGDGRVNENIGLTAVHHVFHSEHNRLVEVTKTVALESGDLAFLSQWLLPGTAPATMPATPEEIAALQWNGERLFQAAKFGTEMQYQHLVFEEFARTIQPNVDAFIDFDDTVDPSIVAEFAHTVYRFGHSMLTETIDRLDADFQSSEIGLIAAFLNPLAFAASGPTPEEAAGAIIRGVTRQVGNEIDEFVTDALRNNLVGLPLDLAAINIARGRDTGVPSLNAARRTFYEATGDSQLTPYTSWADFVQHLKHPESLINFIAAYGTHTSITGATTLDEKRAAATALVLGGEGAPADRLDFLMSTGEWASGADGVTITGLDAVDFWIGGLAEEKMPFGGMLGSTFNFVFETQLEALQNGDRFYYLHRTAGMNFLAELENNSFAKLVMLNTDATHLPALIFSTPGFTFEVDPTWQHTGLNEAGTDGIQGTADDVAGSDGILGNSDPIGEHILVPLVSRDDPQTLGVDTHYLKYTGDEHVVLGGTDSNDVLIASIGDDTLYGDGGNDRLEGGYGNDDIQGGAGDDILTDMGGDDVLKGDAGNDVIHGGNGLNLIIAGPGNDFIITGEDSSEVIAGSGNDFILGSKLNVQMAGNEGDDWIEVGTQDGAPGDNFDPFGRDQIDGHDVFMGAGGFDEMIGEGGDDIMVGSDGPDKMKGMSGYDWVIYQNDRFGVAADMFGDAFNEAPVPLSSATVMDRFAQVEGLSGSAHSDVLRGDDATAAILATAGARGSALTNLDLIAGLRAFLGSAAAGLDGLTETADDRFDGGNIILGGDGSDVIEGRGGDDIIDGDRYLQVRISVRQNSDGTGPELRSVTSLTQLVADMLSGAVNPGQLVIVRELMPGSGDFNFDTAVFSDVRANYLVEGSDGVTGAADLDGDGFITVRHLNPDDPLDLANPGADGVDRLANIERLQFADQAVILADGLNAAPVGSLNILDAASGTADDTPLTGQVLRASVAGVSDADNLASGGAITGPIAYYWQVQTAPGSTSFVDILGTATTPVSSRSFTVTPDLEGLQLRVRAVYQDANGVLENVFSAPSQAVGAGAAPAAAPAEPLVDATQASSGGPGLHLIRSDLTFILAQIKIAEAHAAGADLNDLLPNSRTSFGLRTVDGSYNNLSPGSSEFGAADNVFPRLLDPTFQDAELFDPDGPGPAPATPTSYTQTSGVVVDSQPRTISNLIVDQTANNPAAVAAAADNPDSVTVTSPGLDGIFGTADDKEVFFIPNVAPDEGLSAPFNAWMTFFGQFFDHGLDLVTKGGNGIVFIPLQPDDPLYVEGSATNFMVLTRSTQVAGPGADGILGTADDTSHEAINTTSPFVDQNQTYSSHPSHQVFLRAYEMRDGVPVATGRLITNRDLGADGKYGTGDDVEIGGMATWAVVKAQARDLLGINLTDADVGNIPLLATDAYGNFLRGPNGFPQVVMKGDDGIAGTADDFLMEGDPLAPINLANAVRIGHAFLDDIAHAANPAGKTADSDSVVGLSEAGAYDDELLDAHYIAGDGRVNENIGLTAVHHIFHAEHNRLVEATKQTILQAEADTPGYINDWLAPGFVFAPGMTADQIAWNGERLFQAAKFGTEMQYQHLVFEEFARTIQPNIDIFVGPTQAYDVDIDAAIVAEFAHTVYRFGHSMLTETIDRLDPDFASSEIGLIEAFLNPLAFAASGPTPDEAAGAIVRGVTRQAGNEIDEFVTEALRNNLVGLPLDLAAINLARGRETGVPSLNAARREFYHATGDSNLKPYTSWVDFAEHVKHAASVINFIAAYGTHAELQAADVNTLEEKRAIASALVFGGSVAINAGTPEERLFIADDADREAFLNSTGVYANLEGGITTTGVDAIDFWIGGLAEEKMPFGGMLGSTFNFVFENQLEKLQDGDRFYYLDRTAGLNFQTALENNSFAKMIMANTNATHLPGLVFSTPAFTFEVDPGRQYTGLDEPGADGIQGTADDEAGADGIAGNSDPRGGILLTPLVIRDNPLTPLPDTNYLKYTGDEHVVLGGTGGNDILIASIGDDTLWGDGGNDRLEGGYGNDMLLGGDGDDILTDQGGDDNLQGGDGNDVIHGGNGINLIIGGLGQDFIVTGEDSNESFGGPGSDFILGTNGDEQNMGNEGDDWLEGGLLDGSPGDNFDPNGLDLVKGNDVYLGSGMPDIMNAEGGDDIMVGSAGPGDKYLGASGFDWATFKDDPFGVNIDLTLRAFDTTPIPASGANVLARFEQVEGLAGSAFSDILRGDNADAAVLATAGAQGSALTNLDLIDGLRALLGSLAAGSDGIAGTADDRFDAGNILLGGDGSDLLEGRGGDDLIDGDRWLNVRISVRANSDGSGGELASFDSLRPLVPLMLNGTYNPGQLVIVRELREGSGAYNVDTAMFSGNRANYTVTIDDNGTADDFSDDRVTVTDNVGTDGSDTLRNIERLQFADQMQILVPGLNEGPQGLLSISDTTPEVGQVLTVSAAGVTDADNAASGGALAGQIVYYWQVDPGNGVFEDITVLAGGEVARVTGSSFTVTADLEGLALRVRAVYQDQLGVIETVHSAPTAPVGGFNGAAFGSVLIDDTTPTEDQLLTANLAFTDPNGTTTSVFSFQWQAGSGEDFADIDGATGASFAPGDAEVGLQLRVVVSYVDDQGFAEEVVSAPTAAVANVNDAPAGVLVISDATPTEGQELSVTLDSLVDPDGVDLATVVFTWQSETAPGVWSDVGSGATFTPGQAEVGKALRVQASYVDNFGTAETVGSTPTAVVGDLAIGTAGDDLIVGTAGDDILQGGAGNDTLLGLAGADVLLGEVGNDWLDGGSGADQMGGGTGDDTFIIDDALDVVTEVAGEGTDTVRTSLASFTLGAALENLTFIGSGDFSGIGNGLANTLAGGAGDDLLDGAGGVDTASYAEAGAGVTVSLAVVGAQDTGGAGVDTLVAIENLTGSALADSLAGNGVANVLFGGDGGDTLSGAGGRDLLDGGAGNDTLNGGIDDDQLLGQDGNDTLLGDAGRDTLAGGSGDDTLSGGAGRDVLSGDAGNDTLDGGADDDVLSGGEGNDLLLGGTGRDTLNGDAGDDVLQGGLDRDTLTGGAGNDVLQGDGGDDALSGDDGNDLLLGGIGRDVLSGGSGDDLLDGGADRDIFVFAAAGFGHDRIVNFDALPAGGQDRVNLAGLGITGATFAARVTITDVGADTLVTIGDDSIRFVGIDNANTIEQSDFLLA